jgi:hypothetical protein
VEASHPKFPPQQADFFEGGRDMNSRDTILEIQTLDELALDPTSEIYSKGLFTRCLHFWPFVRQQLVSYDETKNVSGLFVSRVTGDRCYDFLNIFAEKFGKKLAFFDSKQNFDHT